MQIEGEIIDRRGIHFEVASVDDHAERSADGERDAIDGAVGDVDEFDFVGTDLYGFAGADFVQLGVIEQAVFFEFLANQSQSEFCAVDGDVEVAKNIRNGADVVLVAVSEDNGANGGAVLL